LLDTYIILIQQFWPRMFYRSGWLRCVLVISIRLVFEFGNSRVLLCLTCF
jgi:hypothetical protein